MTRILRLLFGIYALLIFTVTLIIAFILYVIIFSLAGKHAPFIAHKLVSRNWAKTLFLFYGIRIKIINRKILDRNQTYVFAGNHRSLLDIPAYAIATRHPIRFLAKAELTKIPLMGYIIKRLYVSVDRKDKVARARSMENMMQSLRDGISVFICPEGTRNKTDAPVLPFHDGAFRLAIQAQIPLAILVIKNSDKLLSPIRPFELKPGKLTCKWIEPIQTKGMTPEDLGKLKETVWKKMAEVFQE